MYGRQAGVCCSSVEDQDSSGEGGLSSNWWVLGSQGCPLSAPGDATLQTLPQLALSPLGTQSQLPRSETSEYESADKSTERDHYESQESDGEQRNSDEKAELGAGGRQQDKAKEQERKHKREHKHKDNKVTANVEGNLFSCSYFPISFHILLLSTFLQPLLTMFVYIYSLLKGRLKVLQECMVLTPHYEREKSCLFHVFFFFLI